MKYKIIKSSDVAKHPNMSLAPEDYIEEEPKVIIELNLKSLLKKKGMSQKELALRANIREATISEMANNMRTDINKESLAKIMRVLGVYDISEFINVIVVDKTK